MILLELYIVKIVFRIDDIKKQLNLKLGQK